MNHITGKLFQEYNPVDLGFLVPLAYGKAPGVVLGRQIRGKLGYFLHYLMCIYRSSWTKKFGIIKDLLYKKVPKNIC